MPECPDLAGAPGHAAVFRRAQAVGGGYAGVSGEFL